MSVFVTWIRCFLKTGIWMSVFVTWIRCFLKTGIWMSAFVTWIRCFFSVFFFFQCSSSMLLHVHGDHKAY